jgi:hypothetical protein
LPFLLLNIMKCSCPASFEKKKFFMAVSYGFHTPIHGGFGQGHGNLIVADDYMLILVEHKTHVLKVSCIVLWHFCYYYTSILHEITLSLDNA